MNHKTKFKELLDDYEEGKLWSKERHKYFPSSLSQTVFNFLISLKLFTKNNITQIFPKPLLSVIIESVVNLIIVENIKSNVFDIDDLF